MGELKPQAEEARRLSDQMDEFRNAFERAAKAEARAEKYSTKLDEAGRVIKGFKEMEAQNVDLHEQNARLVAVIENGESEHLASSVSATLKKQVTMLQAAQETLSSKNVQLSTELSRVEEINKREKKESRVLQEQLSERVRELEKGGDDESILVENHSLEEALKGTSVVELRATIAKLQKQIAVQKVDASAKIGADAEKKLQERYEGVVLDERRKRLEAEKTVEEILAADGCV